jgi:hypothetical protein
MSGMSLFDVGHSRHILYAVSEPYASDYFRFTLSLGGNQRAMVGGEQSLTARRGERTA